MKFIFWFPVYIVLLWVCAAPYSVAAEDVEGADCFKNDLASATRFVACRVAAEAGHADAQYSLGYMYSTGEGVPQDYAGAAVWYRRAAEQGDASAQVNLGSMYYKGEGVPQDYILAYMWFNLAGTNGPKKLLEVRDLVAQEMSPAQVAEAQHLSQQWTATHRARAE